MDSIVFAEKSPIQPLLLECGTYKHLERKLLFSTEEIVSPKDAAGVERRRFLIGDPEIEDGRRGAQYGAVDFELSDNGNRLTITDVSMGKGHEDLVREAVTDLIDEYSQASIEWDTNGDEKLEAVKDSLMEQNGGSLQISSQDQVQGHQKVVGAISRAFGSSLNNKQLYTAADVLEVMARTKGMTGEQYLAKYFADGGFRKLSSAEGKAVLRQSGLSEGDVNGLTQFVTDGKAIVYAAEHGNFSTFVHESFHVLERVTDSTQQLEDAIQAAGRSGQLAGYVKAHDRLFSDGLFTTDDEGKDIDAATRITQVVESWGDGKDLTKAQQELRSEIMARLFEGYLYDGKTFSPQLKTIFAKIAQWMRRIYRGMETHGVTLTDDIVKAYDDLLTRKDSGVAIAEGSVMTLAQRQEREQSDFKSFAKWLTEADVKTLASSRTYRTVYDRVPDILGKCFPGMEDLPLKIKESVVPHSLRRHPGMTIDIMLEALGAVTEPLAIGQSRTVPNASVVLTNVYDRNGAHVIVPIHLVQEEDEGLCIVASVYGKDHKFKEWAESTNWVYMKQGTNIPDVAGSNSLGRGGSASIPTIASNSDSVKPDVLRQGYDYAQNMSNNAVEAYSEGKRPLWKWRKSDISQAVETLAGKDIVSDMDAAEMKESFLERTEWHHVGSAYNKQDFYAISLDKIRNTIGKLPEEELDNYERASVYTLELLTDVMHRQHLGKEEAINWIGRYLHDHKTADGSGIFLYGTYGLTGEVVDELKGVSGELLSWYNFGKGEDVSWLDHVPSGAVEGKDHIVLGQAEPDVLAQAAEANAAPGRADVDKVLAQTVAVEGHGMIGINLLNFLTKMLVENSPRLSLKASWALGTAADVSSVSEPVRVPCNSTIASDSDFVNPDVLRQGYDYKPNMSNNAVEVYSKGKRPLWKWSSTRLAGSSALRRTTNSSTPPTTRGRRPTPPPASRRWSRPGGTARTSPRPSRS